MILQDCTPEEFRCHTQEVECVQKEFVCDGRVDCKDRSDEVDCDGDHKKEEEQAKPTTTSPTRRPLPPYEAPTSSTQRPIRPGHDQGGKPIPVTRRDSRTEDWAPVPAKCQFGQTRCANGACIDVRQRCDGHSDCDDDELRCPPSTRDGNERYEREQYERDRYRQPDRAVNLKVFDTPQTLSSGKDCYFRCRDENAIGGPTRIYWTRANGRPLQSPRARTDTVDQRLAIEKLEIEDSGVYECHAHGTTDFRSVISHLIS